MEIKKIVTHWKINVVILFPANIHPGKMMGMLRKSCNTVTTERHLIKTMMSQTLIKILLHELVAWYDHYPHACISQPLSS